MTAPASSGRREIRRLLELIGVFGLAVCQPVLDVVGRTPEQVAFRGVSSSSLLPFGIAVALGPPVVVWGAGVVVGIVVPRARGAAHGLGIAFGAALLVAQLVDALPAAVGLALAVAGGAAVALARRAAPVALWLRLLALAPVAFVGLFAIGSSATDVTASVDVADVTVGRPAPVVMVVFDEFPLTSIIRRDGTIDDELYPNLSALAGDATWFRRATAVSNSTWHALPAVLTGTEPVDGEGPFAIDHPDSLFTLLGGTYEMNVSETISRLCPSNLCRPRGGTGGLGGLFGDAARVLGDRVTGDESDPVAGLVERGDNELAFEDFDRPQPERFTEFLAGIDAGGPSLNYLHLLLPHVPYRFLPDGSMYEGPDPDVGRIDDRWASDPWPATLGRQRHLLQAVYVDGLIGDLVDRLVELGMYDESLIVLTSDHGIAFDAGAPARGIEIEAVDPSIAPQVAFVPLVVKAPDQRDGTASDQPVSTLDIVPTLAEMLDVELPWPVDGRSALAAPSSGGSTSRYYQSRIDLGVLRGPRVPLDLERGFADVTARGVDGFLPLVGHRWRPYAVGPQPALLGESATDLTPTDAEVDGADAFDDVRPGSGRLPALLLATVDAAPGTPVAVAVDGVVAATAVSFGDGDRTRVAAMLVPDLFSEGANRVTVHRL